MYLAKVHKHWQDLANKAAENRKANSEESAMFQAYRETNTWLNKNSKLLVLLCMFSGGLTHSLRLVNSNLFGMKTFRMGLPKFKQDETVRHKLWLVVTLGMFSNFIFICLYFSIILSCD